MQESRRGKSASNRRRASRHPICQDRSVNVTIERGEGQSPSQIPAELIDISNAGVKLAASFCPTIDDALVLKLQFPSVDLDLSVEAKVCWVQPAGRENWRLGCTLTPKLPEEVLTKLAVGGYIQRRRYTRQSLDVPGSARWEMTQDPFPVRVVNFSAGGFCIACSDDGQVGERLLLELDSDGEQPDPILGVMNWAMRTPDGHRIGCAFVNKRGHELFHRVLSAHSTTPHGCPGRPRFWLKLGMLVPILGGFALLLTYLFTR